MIEFAPSRLADVEPLFATTVHKSQGSQFDVAAVLLPDPTRPCSRASCSTPPSPAPARS